MSQEVYISSLYSYSSLLLTIDSSEKASILLKAFFSLSSQVDLSNTKDYQYTQDLTIDEITRHEIVRAITLTISNKILKNNEITNEILKQINITIVSHLHRIYNACLRKTIA